MYSNFNKFDDKIKNQKAKSRTIQFLDDAVKYVVLTVLCLLYFAVLVVYNSPGALQTNIMKDYSYSTIRYSQIMSSYSWSCVLCFLGGYYVDRISGLNMGLCTFVPIFCLGNALYSIGLYNNIFSVIIIGRIFAGLGGETTGVATSVYILEWFANSRQNLAFAVYNSFSLLEPAFTYQISDPLYNYTLSSYGENVTDEIRQHSLSVTTAIIGGGASVFTIIGSLFICFMYSKNFINNLKKSSSMSLDSWESENKISIREMLKFKPQYWLITSLVALVFTSMYNFVSFSQDYFVSDKNLSIDEADNLTSEYSIITFCTSPIIGFIIDKTGRNLIFIMISILGAAATHVALAFLSMSPEAAMVCLALSMSVFFSAYTPLIGEAVKAHQVATAYGISYSIINIFCAIGFMISGYIVHEFGYRASEVYYLLLLLGAAICGISIILLKNKLNLQI